MYECNKICLQLIYPVQKNSYLCPETNQSVQQPFKTMAELKNQPP